MSFLVSHDCVNFLDLLETLRTTTHGEHGQAPFWLMTGAAQKLFAHAKERVYLIHGDRGKEKKLETVLEPNPKWTLLGTVLDEIRETRQELIEGGMPEYEVGGTLVVVRDDRSASQVGCFRLLLLRKPGALLVTTEWQYRSSVHIFFLCCK